MKYHVLTVRLLMATLCTICIIAVTMLFNGSIENKNNTSSPDQGITLKAPPFINVAYANNQQAPNTASDFLKEEAGISAYTNVGNSIDLTKVEPLFRTIEKQTDEYIVGSMIPPGYEELAEELQEDIAVHLYVHRDGSIVAYLLQSQDTSLIIDWVGYDTDQLSSTTLENTVQRVLTVLGLSSSEISYYDFGFPDATNLMLIADVERDDNDWDSFTIEIPEDFTVYESSWAHAGYNSHESQCLFNGFELSKFEYCYNSWCISHNNIDNTKIIFEKINKILLFNEMILFSDKGKTYCAIALVYREG